MKYAATFNEHRGQKKQSLTNVFVAYLISAPALKASMNALVPDLAMVPKLFTRSALVIPIPESSMVRVLFACRQIREDQDLCYVSAFVFHSASVLLDAVTLDSSVKEHNG